MYNTTHGFFGIIKCILLVPHNDIRFQINSEICEDEVSLQVPSGTH